MCAVTRKKIAVIGAGPGGLTAAMILAHRGVEVDVYEIKPHVGGRNAFLQAGPYRFDVGPTFLMMKHILEEVFLEAGAECANYLTLQALDPMYRLQFDQFTLNCSTNLENMREQIRNLRPGKEKGFDTFIRRESRRFSFMEPCLQQPYLTVASLLSPRLLSALPHLSLSKTVYDVLLGYFQDPDLALAFCFQAKYLGMSAWQCPGAFTMLPFIEYKFGVYHVMGGLSEISQAMAKVARERGAQFYLGAPVQSLLIENRVVRGVILEGGEVRRYDDVILNVDFGRAMTHLVPPGHLRKYSPEKLKRMRLSCSTFMIYLGLDTIYDIPHHAIVMARNYRQNVDDVFLHGRLSEDFSFYVRNASRTDPSLAPPGHSSLYVLAPVPNLRSPICWQSEKAAMRQRVLEALAQRGGCPGIQSHIREERILTPDDWQNEYNVYEGATFNLAHSLGQMLYFRPHNRFEELGNCYLTGGGTHPGSGVPTILESGRIAANLLCRKYRIPFSSYNLLT